MELEARRPTVAASVISHEGPGATIEVPVFLGATAKSEPNVRVSGNNLIAAPRRASRPRATDPSNSGKDRAKAARFFDINSSTPAEADQSEIR